MHELTIIVLTLLVILIPFAVFTRLHMKKHDKAIAKIKKDTAIRRVDCVKSYISDLQLDLRSPIPYEDLEDREKRKKAIHERLATWQETLKNIENEYPKALRPLITFF